MKKQTWFGSFLEKQLKNRPNRLKIPVRAADNPLRKEKKGVYFRFSMTRLSATEQPFPSS